MLYCTAEKKHHGFGVSVLWPAFCCLLPIDILYRLQYCTVLYTNHEHLSAILRSIALESRSKLERQRREGSTRKGLAGSSDTVHLTVLYPNNAAVFDEHDVAREMSAVATHISLDATK